MNKSSLNDPIARSGLESIYDAVHGSIDVRDAPDCGTDGVIARLLGSPMLNRLRRIEQLGFASQQYIAADHSRFAHALGTMHMMRLMIRRLADRHAPPFDRLQILKNYFPDTFGGTISESAAIGRLAQHLLVAALVQDIGELPYNMASIHVYEPDDRLRADVADWIGVGVSGTDRWTGKEIFTVGCLRECWKDSPPNLIDKHFLVFLLTGQSANLQPGEMKALRLMLDGVVDADRLDYVSRDGHHTIGKLGGPDAVIDTLVGFDDDGPIFSDPGPVSQFLASRAHLYATVYLSPTNRFRMVVLIELLKGIANTDDCAKQIFLRERGQQLRIGEFLDLDDVSLSARIRQMEREEHLRKALDSRAQTALSIFVRGEPKYRPMWLPAPSPRTAESLGIQALPELFWDTFTDVGGELYARNSVRVRNAQFQYYNDIQGSPHDASVPLEQCGGPFSLIAKQKSSMLPAPMETSSRSLNLEGAHEDSSLRPMPGCILVFEPEKKSSGFWSQFEAGLKDGKSYNFLMANDPLTPHRIEANTWAHVGFAPPNIFISYANPDKSVVRKIMSSLFRKRRRYCALVEPFQDIGHTPTENILRYLQQAKAVILVVSQEYCRAYMDVDRHVHAEVNYLKQNRGRLILVPVAADPFPTLRDAPFLAELRLNGEAPWMGEDLRELPTPDVDRTIEAVLKFIDEHEAR